MTSDSDARPASIAVVANTEHESWRQQVVLLGLSHALRATERWAALAHRMVAQPKGLFMRRIAMVVPTMLLATLGLAAPAHAATGSFTATSGSVVVTWSGFAGPPFVNICSSSTGSGTACNGIVRLYALSTSAGYESLGTSPSTIQEGTAVTDNSTNNPTVLPAGTYRMTLWDSGTPAVVASELVTIGSGGSSSSASSTPPSIIQQFGKSSVGTCNDAQPDGLNWGGASSGGWGESWSQWVNDGLGGAVCTRTLVHSNSLGHWVVG